MRTEFVFDQPYAVASVKERSEGVRSLLSNLQEKLELRSAADIGCGVGYFSVFLQEMGFDVVGIDGREENVKEARRRYPQIRFDCGNLEDPAILSQGSFDLVFCFGLLYHLENPLLAIRNLLGLTNKALLLESMCAPGDQPWMLLRDEPRVEDQSLTDVAFYATESCLVKMLYRSGFSAVYRLAVLPNHSDFRETPEFSRRRTVLLASRTAVTLADLVAYAEPQEMADPWQKALPVTTRLSRRVKRFFAMPMRSKYLAIAERAQRRFPLTPIPLRLPFGAWWLARNDNLGDLVRRCQFELAETSFVERHVQPGMVVLDIGANQGYYTLLASRKVGKQGRVISFEPSPREREALMLHRKLNRCQNVTISEVAVGSERKKADLFVVQGTQTGCNSLRPPAVTDQTAPVQVEVMQLDEWLVKHAIERVDFIKLDVEGGELDVLKGAELLLERRPRPVILVEIQDLRTEPWGYKAKEIINHLSRKKFKWFQLREDGSLEELSFHLERFDGNFVAWPEERMLEKWA